MVGQYLIWDEPKGSWLREIYRDLFKPRAAHVEFRWHCRGCGVEVEPEMKVRVR